MKHIDPFDVGRRLKLLREMRGKMQKEVCEDLGIGAPHYNSFEIGRKRPNAENAALLAAYYGVTLDYIYLGNLAGIPFEHAKQIESEEARLEAQDLITSGHT